MRQVAVLVGVLFVALIFNSVIPKSSGAPLDRATAEKFILEDARTDYGNDAQYRILKYEENEGKWLIEMDISLKYKPAPQINTECIRTMRRYYSMFPIQFREELYSDVCK